ncbi:hypothetical protein BRD56_05330 [Thermoplasmatales archaeon SW_10_69_26]|nr:MAG: hypothetical protein BRD56_05330 [Thermoplasmatales archaeon SW_10_69_26]
MTLLGIDPSLRNTGVVSLDPSMGTITRVEVIRTSKQADRKNLRVGEDDLRRARRIARELEQLVDQEQPVAVFGELPGGSRSNRASKGFGIVLGAIGAVTELRDLPTGWETQFALKKACTGDGQATKTAVADHVQDHYAWEDELPDAKTRRQHVFDAAAALYANRECDLYRMAVQQSTPHASAAQQEGEHT